MASYFRALLFWPAFILVVILLALFLPPLALFARDKERFYAATVALAARLLLIISATQVNTNGREKLTGLDAKTGLVMAANHASFLDYFVLKAKLPFPVKFVVWWSGFQLPLLKTLYRGLGYIAAGRRGGDLAASRQLFAALKAGERVVIFSSPSFKEGEFAFTDGIIRLAQAARVPILPVALKNCGAVLPLGKLLFQPGTVKLYFGEPAMYRSADDLKSVIAGLYSCL